MCNKRASLPTKKQEHSLLAKQKSFTGSVTYLNMFSLHDVFCVAESVGAAQPVFVVHGLDRREEPFTPYDGMCHTLGRFHQHLFCLQD